MNRHLSGSNIVLIVMVFHFGVVGYGLSDYVEGHFNDAWTLIIIAGAMLVLDCFSLRKALLGEQKREAIIR